MVKHAADVDRAPKQAGQKASQKQEPVGNFPRGNGTAPCNGARERFRQFASMSATAVGSPWAFIIAVALILGWAITGPIFKFSDTWQLVINTGTTIITFLMVFLIQNTQNRDARAIHLKLDELIRSVAGPRNKLVDLENCSDEEIEQLEKEFKRFHERHNGVNDRTARAE